MGSVQRKLEEEMRIILWFAVGLFCWYVIGLLSYGIGMAAFSKITKESWKNDRRNGYQMAWMGVIIAIGVLIALICKVLAGNSIFKSFVRATDWIVAGFREPPANDTSNPS